MFSFHFFTIIKNCFEQTNIFNVLVKFSQCFLTQNLLFERFAYIDFNRQT